MIKRQNSVTLPDSDAAGILFFGNYYKLAHVIYEDFMDEIGYSLKYIIDESDILILIVHSEADYKKSLELGDRYDLTLQVKKIGGTSFELAYSFVDESENTIADLKTVHVVIDKKSKKPIRIPDDLKEKLKKHLA